MRKVNGVEYARERIDTPDGDFLDLDWLPSGSDHLIIICHGLEGSTTRAYIQGMAKQFHKQGWDALTWNFRGCSEEINKNLRFYHSGATDDLDTVIQHVLKQTRYTKLFLLGFSLGGNIVLKYLGEQGSHLPPIIKKAMGISVPLDLHAGCLQISHGFNNVYSRRFLGLLKDKVRRKAINYPSSFDLVTLQKTKRLIDFDDLFTAPLHGFKDAADYYYQCSSQRFIKNITIPTLIVNAKNDPFLAPSCYPVDAVSQHPFVELLVPARGGHCGFSDREFSGEYWSEVLAWSYMNS